jgi:hypothetical protein
VGSDTLAPHGKEFWQTETSGNSPTWEGGMGVATTLFNTLDVANGSVFMYWQYSDGVGAEKFSLMTDGVPNAKYYAAKQFYRYIRPGFVHVGDTVSGSDQILSTTFKDPKTGAMTTVIMNKGGEDANVSSGRASA